MIIPSIAIPPKYQYLSTSVDESSFAVNYRRFCDKSRIIYVSKIYTLPPASDTSDELTAIKVFDLASNQV